MRRCGWHSRRRAAAQTPRWRRIDERFRTPRARSTHFADRRAALRGSCPGRLATSGWRRGRAPWWPTTCRVQTCAARQRRRRATCLAERRVQQQHEDRPVPRRHVLCHPQHPPLLLDRQRPWRLRGQLLAPYHRPPGSPMTDATTAPPSDAACNPGPPNRARARAPAEAQSASVRSADGATADLRTNVEAISTIASGL